MNAYNGRLDSDIQISSEEQIASIIQEAVEAAEDSKGRHDYVLTNEDCADLGREILKRVLLQFRPDLFD